MCLSEELALITDILGEAGEHLRPVGGRTVCGKPRPRSWMEMGAQHYRPKQFSESN